jgi:5-methylcytosine-specific restriction endonuclease McrA
MDTISAGVEGKTWQIERCYNSFQSGTSMNEVLVLNANFEPINVCSLRRAVGMMLTEKARLVMNGRGEIHSANFAFPCPSIIRLQQMVHRPRPRISLTRREILRRDNYTCQYCGKHTVDLTIDHIVPRHLGGQHVWQNVVAACSSCNHHKGGRTLEGAHMHLKHVPQEPPINARYLYSHYLHENGEWEPFLEGW